VNDVKEMSRTVRSSELFVGIAECEVEEVLSRARAVEFMSGDVIHAEDDPIARVLLLMDGRIKKSKCSGNGQEAVLRLGVPGELICEPTFLPRSKHSSTVLAIQDCKALAWDCTSFNALLDRFPDLLTNVEQILASRLAELTQRFCEVSNKTASPRLANGLVYLVGRIGEAVGSHIELRVSQETLGQLTGMTLNSVWLQLSIWKGQGIVKLRRGIVEIHSLPHLLTCGELAHCPVPKGRLAPKPVNDGLNRASTQ
jgi:CRP-like cAMP-binding protein